MSIKVTIYFFKEMWAISMITLPYHHQHASAMNLNFQSLHQENLFVQEVVEIC